MAKRQIPVRPNLDQLKRQAKELLRSLQAGDLAARDEFAKFHPRWSALEDLEDSPVKLADAQLVLARAYGIASWPRLVQACQLVDAIHRDDVEAVRELITKHPHLLVEDALGMPSNWGPPMSYAANLGRDRIIEMLASAGAADIQKAFDRACLRGQIKTARWLLEQGAKLERGIVMGPCETLNADGLALLIELGAELCDEKGNRLAPLGLILQTYTRRPVGKHRCLELLAEQSVELSDSPVMAFHRGRLDLLEDHLKRDPLLLSRRFSYREIYPVEVGCDVDETSGLHGTTIAGTTLLHLSVDFDEMEIAEWLLEQGADPNARAAIDDAGFGGHTPLFNVAVSQANVNGRQRDAAMAKLLLSHGADANMRASIRKGLRFVEDESIHVYLDVTPLEYAKAFHEPRWTCKAVTELLEQQSESTEKG